MGRCYKTTTAVPKNAPKASRLGAFGLPKTAPPRRLPATGSMTDFVGVDVTDFSRLRTGRSNGALPTRKAAVQAISDMGPVVYALQQGDTIKIGWTSNLAQRIHSLGGWRLVGFRLDGTRAAETEIHRSLAGRAIKGREWYPHDDPSVIAVVNDMRGEVGLSPL